MLQTTLISLSLRAQHCCQCSFVLFLQFSLYPIYNFTRTCKRAATSFILILSTLSSFCCCHLWTIVSTFFSHKRKKTHMLFYCLKGHMGLILIYQEKTTMDLCMPTQTNSDYCRLLDASTDCLNRLCAITKF